MEPFPRPRAWPGKDPLPKAPPARPEGTAGAALRREGCAPPSVGARRLAAEHRDHLARLLAPALRAGGGILLQTVMLADRQAELKALAAGLALELVDSHGNAPPPRLVTSIALYTVSCE